ncbi:MAG: carbamoyltransferase family protein [Thermodesulfobacteriota bacterium]
MVLIDKTKRRTGRILGISPLDKDATASLYVDGKWKAIAEERLSRIKMHAGFPKRAVEELLRRAGLSPEDLQHVVYPFMPWWIEGSRMVHGYLRDLPFTLTNGTPWSARLSHLKAYGKWCIDAILDHRKYHRELIRELSFLGLDHKLMRIEHHASHAAVAYLTSGFEEAIALTLDWYGGGLSGSVNLCTSKGIERLHNFHYPHSIGLFYAQVTSALGFKPSQHEGKIVGLAAYGDSNVLGPTLLARFVCKQGDFRYLSGMDRKFSQGLAKRFPHEHVAAAYQHALEVLVCEITAYWTRVTGLQDVVLAGGVAANVKMNQRIADLEGVRRIFIHPNMGDGGTGVGAILAVLLASGEVKSEEWETCYLGPDFTDEQMEAAIRQAGLEPRHSESVAKDVAKALAQGKVVARFAGAMEYGPRALGNRSILCPATDPKVNSWLNRRLGRTEFMPFAPVTLFEHCQERYLNIDKFLVSARFMTITCECTDLMKKESPAAVHVDGTARPQIIRPENNPGLYAILEEYYRLTGIPTLINTSFNMHEEPIVCTPEDAVRAFLAGNLDYLSMGSFLVASKSSDSERASAAEPHPQAVAPSTKKSDLTYTVELSKKAK